MYYCIEIHHVRSTLKYKSAKTLNGIYEVRSGQELELKVLHGFSLQDFCFTSLVII